MPVYTGRVTTAATANYVTRLTCTCTQWHLLSCNKTKQNKTKQKGNLKKTLSYVNGETSVISPVKNLLKLPSTLVSLSTPFCLVLSRSCPPAYCNLTPLNVCSSRFIASTKLQMSGCVRNTFDNLLCHASAKLLVRCCTPHFLQTDGLNNSSHVGI